jgi:hypothetical protein
MALRQQPGQFPKSKRQYVTSVNLSPYLLSGGAKTTYVAGSAEAVAAPLNLSEGAKGPEAIRFTSGQCCRRERRLGNPKVAVIKR